MASAPRSTRRVSACTKMLDLVCFKKRRVIEEDIFVQSTHSEECAKEKRLRKPLFNKGPRKEQAKAQRIEIADLRAVNQKLHEDLADLEVFAAVTAEDRQILTKELTAARVKTDAAAAAAAADAMLLRSQLAGEKALSADLREQVRRLTLASTQQQEDFSARLTRQQLEFSAHCELLQQAVDGALQEKETQLNGAQQQLLQALLEAEDTRAQTVQLGAQVYAYMHAATNAMLEAECLREHADSLQQRLNASRAAIPVIPEERCTFVRGLGKGGCATVDLHHLQLAVKKPLNEEEARNLRREALVLAALDHPNIPQPDCWVKPRNGGHLGLGMPYAALGTLEDLLWTKDGEMNLSPSLLEELQVMEQLASALLHAHRHGIAHGDVKTANVVMGADGRVLLIDWGFASKNDEDRTHWRGTIGYARPAGFFDVQKTGPEDDTYGLLAVGLEMRMLPQPLQAELMDRRLQADSRRHMNEAITAKCREAAHLGVREDDAWHRLIAGQFLGYGGFTEDDFEDLFEDEATPLEYMQLLRRGLCKEAARAEAPMPTLPELLAVLKREMARLSTAAAARTGPC